MGRTDFGGKPSSLTKPAKRVKYIRAGVATTGILINHTCFIRSIKKKRSNVQLLDNGSDVEQYKKTVDGRDWPRSFSFFAFRGRGYRKKCRGNVRFCK